MDDNQRPEGVKRRKEHRNAEPQFVSDYENPHEYAIVLQMKWSQVAFPTV